MSHFQDIIVEALVHRGTDSYLDDYLADWHASKDIKYA